jgi:hypothetical protein
MAIGMMLENHCSNCTDERTGLNCPIFRLAEVAEKADRLGEVIREARRHRKVSLMCIGVDERATVSVSCADQVGDFKQERHRGHIKFYIRGTKE